MTWHPTLDWAVWKLSNQVENGSLTLGLTTGTSPVPGSQEGLRLNTKHVSCQPVAVRCLCGSQAQVPVPEREGDGIPEPRGGGTLGCDNLTV